MMASGLCQRKMDVMNWRSIGEISRCTRRASMKMFYQKLIDTALIKAISGNPAMAFLVFGALIFLPVHKELLFLMSIFRPT